MLPRAKNSLRSPRKPGNKTQVPVEAIGEDRTRLESLQGPLQKQNRKGRWQTRYFRTVNHYIVYFASSAMVEVRRYHDVRNFESARVVGRFGHIEIDVKSEKVDSGEVTLFLKAQTQQLAQMWVDNLNERRTLFEGHKTNRRKLWKHARTRLIDKVSLEGPIQQYTRSHYNRWKKRYLCIISDELRFYKSKPTSTEELKKYVSLVNVHTILDVSTTSDASFSISQSKKGAEELSDDVASGDKNIFILHTPNKDNDVVMRACDTGEGIEYVSAKLMCSRWRNEIMTARQKAIKSSLQKLDSHIEKKEKAAKHASNPYVVQKYDISTSADVRRRDFVAQFVELFGAEVENCSIQEIASRLNGLLEEISEVAEICQSLNPSRIEVFKDQIDTFHPLIVQKLKGCLNSSCSQDILEAHESLHLLDFLKRYSDLLEKHIPEHHSELTGESFSIEMNGSSKTNIVVLLSEMYIKRARVEFLDMCLRISNYIMDRPNEAIHDASGVLSTSGPVDLMNMIHQYIENAAKSGLTILQAKVFVMCTEGVDAYIHSLELRVSQIRHLLTIDFEDINLGDEKDVKHKGNPNTLLFLCVLVNDAEMLVKSFDDLEDEYADLIEDHEHLFDGITLEEHISNTIHDCQSLGQLALLQMGRIVFDDLHPMMPDLFSAPSPPDFFSPVLETMLLTISDYCEDFEIHIFPEPYLAFLRYCYDSTLSKYTARFIEANTILANRAKSGVRTSRNQKWMDTSLSKLCQRLKHDLKKIRDFFSDRAKHIHAFRGPERSFRNQQNFLNFLEDVVYRLNISQVHVAFKCQLDRFASQIECFPHILVLFSRLLLLRNYKREEEVWKAESLDYQRKTSEFPFTRKEILTMCFESLAAEPFSVNAESLQRKIQAQEQEFRELILRLPKESEIKKMHKRGEVVLKGEAAQASLDIVRSLKAQNLFIRTAIGIPGDRIELQLFADAKGSGHLSQKARKSRRGSILKKLLSSSSQNEREDCSDSMLPKSKTLSFLSVFRSPKKKTDASLAAAKARAVAAANPLAFSAEAPIAPGGVGTIQSVSLEQERALKQGQMLLQMSAITQEEYDELEISIMAAHSRLVEEDALDNTNLTNVDLTANSFVEQDISFLQKEIEREWLRGALRNTLYSFTELTEDMQDAIVNAFELVATNGTVINQGDEGDSMFIVKSGKFDICVNGKIVNTIGEGCLFGELAMLFNAPRNASVMYHKDKSSDKNGMLWKITRLSFKTAINEIEDDAIDSSAIISRLSEQFRTDNRFRRKRKPPTETSNSNSAANESEQTRKIPSTRKSIRSMRSRTINFQNDDSTARMQESYESIQNPTKSIKDPKYATPLSSSFSLEKNMESFEPKTLSTPSHTKESSPEMTTSTKSRDWDAWLYAQQEKLKSLLDNGMIDKSTHDRRLKLVENRWAQNC